MLELNVAGMTCGRCGRAVTQAIRAVEPEAEVQVDLAAKRVRVDGRGSADALIRVLGEAGYPAVVAYEAAPAAVARKGCSGCR
jgi:copper chaperone